jgi:uncharacterized protein (DUF1697 family)
MGGSRSTGDVRRNLVHDVLVTRYIALLRGVNVGGNNRLPMADLRTALESDGLSGVRTYIQSGNVLFDSSARSEEQLGSRVHDLIATGFGLDVLTIVISAAQLRSIIERTPYGGESDPKRVHVIFLREAPSEATRLRLHGQQAAARERGGRDTVTVDGSVAYLHTPDGFGNSELAKTITTRGRKDALEGTARNWSTVTALFELAVQDPG